MACPGYCEFVGLDCLMARAHGMLRRRSQDFNFATRWRLLHEIEILKEILKVNEKIAVSTVFSQASCIMLI
jgi:hypothetical protein